VSAAAIYLTIHAYVRRIPRGRLSTYGSIARAVGASGPRQVGYALHALADGSAVPWHRVLNAQGRISLPGEAGAQQRQRLAAEGVLSGVGGRYDLSRLGWAAPLSTPAKAGESVSEMIRQGNKKII
jgi:methylated-DNA-protein-cysteine methyltransferase-like protein